MEEMQMIDKIVNWLMGPITGMVKAYVEAKANVEIKQIERQTSKDVITAEVKKAIINDAAQRDALVAKVVEADRKNSNTSWIRPVVVGLSIAYWVIIALTQMQYNGTPILPLTLTIPAGGYGELLFYFPMGVIGTFLILRPIEKVFMK